MKTINAFNVGCVEVKNVVDNEVDTFRQDVGKQGGSKKSVSVYTGCPDSVTIAEYAKRFRYSGERRLEVLEKLDKGEALLM